MEFREENLKSLWRPDQTTDKFSMGQVTIVGGGELFHGAPILAIKGTSRLVGMVYACLLGAQRNVLEKVKGAIGAFIAVDLDEVDDYIKKSDVVLIGPGMMRNRYEKDGFVCDNAGRETAEISKRLIGNNKDKLWLIDGGSLQVLHKEDLPKGAVITPNRKEMELLFGVKIEKIKIEDLEKLARDYNITILHKGEMSIATDGIETMTISGGDLGLVKGATGDIIAGIAAGLMVHNSKVLSLAAASFLVKKASERLAKKYGQMYNGDDLVEEARVVYGEMVNIA